MIHRAALAAILLLVGFGSAPAQEKPRENFEGVRKVWVSASQWPNSRTQETLA